MRTVIYNEFDYQEFDELVNKYYQPKVRFECISDSEWHNDSAYTFVSIKKQELDEYEKDSIAKMIVGEGYYSVNYILKDLVTKGILPEGHYLIAVCW